MSILNLNYKENNMLIAKDIVKSYKSQQVLQGVSLTVNDGEFVSIMGESGSGKSTLLSILSGNMKADSGSVLLDGEDISAFDDKALARLRREKLGFVYQSLNLIPTLNATDNILLPVYFAKRPVAEGKERLKFLAQRLEIEKLLSKFPDSMSGGERQRVAIARALINEPKIIMLDEPTGSLDSRTTGEVLNLLSYINKELGITVIQVTHSIDATKFSDRIIRICDGQVVS